MIEGFKTSFELIFEGFSMLGFVIFTIFKEIVGLEYVNEYEPMGSILSMVIALAGIISGFVLFAFQCFILLLILVSILTVTVTFIKIISDYVIPAIPLFIIAKGNNCKYA